MIRSDEPLPGTDAVAREPVPPPLRVLVNESAGHTRGSLIERIRRALEEVGVSAEVSAGGRLLDPALRALIDAPGSVVGVGGGDGTVRSAAQLVVGRGKALAVFPTGTLNHFSRSIGIEDIEAAAGAVARGHQAAVGVGRVNDIVFLNTATFGLYADVLRRRERLRRWTGKWPAALVSFLVTIARYRPVRVLLDVDGRTLVRDTALVRVGIGRETFPVAKTPLEERRTPELEIAILRAHTRPRLLALGARTLLFALGARRMKRDPAVEILHARSFSLQSDRHRIGITLDGEIIRIAGPLVVTVHDEALVVVVGAEDDGAGSE